MPTLEEMTDAILSLWAAHVAVRQLHHLVDGTSLVYETGVSVSFTSSYMGWIVARRGCVIVSGGGPIPIDMPEFMTLSRMVPCRRFYNELDFAINCRVKQWAPSTQPEADALMLQLRQSLGLDDDSAPEPDCHPDDDFYFEVDPGPDPDPDAEVILAYLNRCVDERIGSPVGVTFWNDIYHDHHDPEMKVFRPAYFTMTPLCPDTVPPEDRGNLRTRNLGFCERFEDYLERYYYPKYSDQRAGIAELMQGLRKRLAG